MLAPTIRTALALSAAVKPRVDAAVELAEEHRHVRRADRREFLDATRVRNAVVALNSLPDAGSSLHVIMRGNFNAWDLVPAVLRLIEPATIAELRVATLGFNRRNAQQLVELIDARQIGRCDFICSVYFERHERETCEELATALRARDGRFLAIRCHAKLLLFRTSDGRHFVSESSANLRSCKNIEQLTLTHASDVHAFHCRWMDSLLADPAAKSRVARAGA